ncbi:hypothetical protein Pmani_011580 [Petrolisthes manimaculis]|uniref:Uncharacterized protein n=1 Tax=Petrolisthes manimaculis TaxID=1843537 RepID=A0AAE1UEB1_9EUCA|nr:hypothetical protein Pmani_011580 [Petrolisthes manimaculis]
MELQKVECGYTVGVCTAVMGRQAFEFLLAGISTPSPYHTTCFQVKKTKQTIRMAIYELVQLKGHRLRVETIALFPFMDYKATGLQDRSVLQKDSLNKRVLEVLAKKLNFTYVIYEAPMRTTGVEDKNGNYNGLMGQLQREEADLSSILALTLFRFKVADFVRICPTDKVTVISLKPTLLPQQLALVRPFAGEVWFGVGIGVVVWGITTWSLQWLWNRLVGRLRVHLSTFLLYGWGALTEQPPLDPSVNLSGQMLVGWWLVFCLIISTGFKSSLIAHLTVQGKTKPIETLRDLVEVGGGGGWRWAMEPILLKLAPGKYFSQATDPITMEVNKRMEAMNLDQGLKEMLKGRFVMIQSEMQMQIIIPSLYTDSRGQNPYYVSKKGFSTAPAFGWLFRRGTPLLKSLRPLIRRLDDTGLLSYWMDKVKQRRVTEIRAVAKPSKFTESLKLVFEAHLDTY